MIIDLSAITFTNDFFTADTKDGGSLTLNVIDENIDGTLIKGINIVYTNQDNNINVRCPVVIGMENEYISLKSSVKENESKVLTLDNKDTCTIEVFEKDDTE